MAWLKAAEQTHGCSEGTHPRHLCTHPWHSSEGKGMLWQGHVRNCFSTSLKGFKCHEDLDKRLVYSWEAGCKQTAKIKLAARSLPRVLALLTLSPSSPFPGHIRRDVHCLQKKKSQNTKRKVNADLH